MLRLSGVSSKWCRSCPESELRPAAQIALLSAPALYRAWERVGLSAIRPSSLAMTMILIGLGTGGCSVSRNDGGAFAKTDDRDVTGSIGGQARDPVPTDSDLAFA